MGDKSSARLCSKEESKIYQSILDHNGSLPDNVTRLDGNFYVFEDIDTEKSTIFSDNHPQVKNIAQSVNNSKKTAYPKSKTVFCRKCKMEIPKGAKVCAHCGAKQQSIGCGGLIGAFAFLAVVIVLIIFIVPTCVGYSRRGNNTSTSSVATISKEDYIKSCETIDFNDLARNPDKYKGQRFKFTGKVIQVVEASYGDEVSLRINVTKGDYIYTDTVFATVNLPSGSDRILEDDIITFYGDCAGLYSYESVLHEKISLPKIDIKYFTISDD